MKTSSHDPPQPAGPALPVSAADVEFVSSFRQALLTMTNTSHATSAINDDDDHHHHHGDGDGGGQQQQERLGGLLLAITSHLAQFRQAISSTASQGAVHSNTINAVNQACPCLTAPLLSDSWGPVVSERVVAADGHSLSPVIIIIITGPAPGDRFQVTAGGHDDAARIARCVAAIDAACRRVKEIQDRAIEARRKLCELKEAQEALRQPAEATVGDHIDLLGKYNNLKDAGQRVIGLIAENRGVPIRCLYEEDHYGVGPDD